MDANATYTRYKSKSLIDSARKCINYWIMIRWIIKLVEGNSTGQMKYDQYNH